MHRRPKRGQVVNFKDYDIKVLFCIRDNIKALFGTGLKNKYFENVQKRVIGEIERRAEKCS